MGVILLGKFTDWCALGISAEVSLYTIYINYLD